MLRKNTDDLFSNGDKGDWCFVSSGENEYMFIKYGDTWEDICTVKVLGAGSWEWDGSVEEPTLSPSIKVSKPNLTLWHGFMKKGILIEA